MSEPFYIMLTLTFTCAKRFLQRYETKIGFSIRIRRTQPFPSPSIAGISSANDVKAQDIQSSQLATLSAKQNASSVMSEVSLCCITMTKCGPFACFAFLFSFLADKRMIWLDWILPNHANILLVTITGFVLTYSQFFWIDLKRSWRSILDQNFA